MAFTDVPEPIFIETDPAKILAEIVAQYQTLSGKTLQPAHPEQLIFNVFAYRETLVRQGIQSAAVQNLLRFASRPILDYLGDLVGVKRLPPTGANVTLEIFFITGHGDSFVPVGTRVATTDGKVVFVTTEEAPAPTGAGSFQVAAEALTVGTVGNGYVAGTITNLLDPSALIESVTNLNTSANGTDEEVDDLIRERIQLAPGQYSNAGSRAAYEYFTRAAHTTIIDVEITTPVPGTVEVFPLVKTGITTPAGVINAVIAALNSEKVRPLTDTVIVTSPTAVTYSITANLTFLAGVDIPSVTALVQSKLDEFTTVKRLKLGRDVIEAQVKAVCMVEGIYNVTLTSWVDKIIGATEFPKCTGITLNNAGTNVG